MTHHDLQKKSVGSEKLFVILFCIYIVTWYLQLGSRVGVLGAIRFEFLLGTFLLLVGFFKVFTVDKPSPLRPIIVFYISVLAFYSVFSYDRSNSIDIFYNRVVKFSMMALFFAAFVRTEWALRMAVTAFLIAMAKLGQEGLFGWISGGLVWENQGVMRLHGSTMLYRHPNSLSGMGVGCLPFIYYLYPLVNKWQKLFLLFLLACCTVIIIFTASRTGYVATLLLGMYLSWDLIKKNKMKFFIFIAMVIPALVGFTPDQYKERFISIFTLEEAEGNSSGTRLEIIEDAFEIFLKKPWGVGVAAFPKVREDTFGRAQDTHNLYLELLTNLGVWGLLIFLYFIYKMMRLNKQVIKGLECDENMRFVVAISKAVVAFLLSRLFLGMFGMDTYEIYWWFALGLTLSSFSIYRNYIKSNNRKFLTAH
ncbi:O-antigen ligase family protein [Cellvibrio polysaccharolyticus]|uniref:Polymerase n=1 Tax=Cellvibrio polysaccharolyticus TaxID=2082724 RepID=A0A928V0G0_9GAMM|nr:O-antigen ligase family protein [Cellvibrio polysaccharolyticus]MBE8716032.1 polymerase [Cellvibrio polysaccharolyticus]